MNEIVNRIDNEENKLYNIPTIAPNPLGLPKVSASKIKVARTCGRKYYYKYILPYNERPEEQKNIYALKGTALHSAIERYYKHGDKPAAVFQEVMLATLNEWQEKGYKVIGEEYLPKALKDGKEMLKLIQWEAMVPESLEHRFLLPFPNPEAPIVMIDGIIDMITIEGSVIDHKSNSKLPNAVELAHDPQFILYRWAYEQIYDFAPYSVAWHHLKTGKLIESGVSKGYGEKLAQLTSDIQDILAMQSYPRRQLDSECRQCPFFSKCYDDTVADIGEE